MKHVIDSVLIVLILAIPEAASSQLADVRETVAEVRESTFSPTTVSAEIKPLPTLLIFVPGVKSLGAGAELSAGGNIATFVNGFVMDSNFPQTIRGRTTDEGMSVEKMQGFGGDLGVRFYQYTGRTDSWYGGAKVGYALGISRVTYKDQPVDHTLRTVMPGVEAGYRWVWANNLLVRLGAGLDGNIVQENNATPNKQQTAVTDDAEDKLESYPKVAAIPRVDVGVGYVF